MQITSLTDPCDYDRILDEETPQAKRIASYLAGYNITRVLDVGCGPANYVEAMRDAGISAFGIDIDERCLRSVYCMCMDLTTADCPVQAPVVLSLEVGEHIPREHSKRYIEFIAQSGATMVVFSAARHGQTGEGHINCQDKSYWATRFEWCGYKYDPNATWDFIDYMKQGYHLGWLIQNVMIFYKHE